MSEESIAAYDAGDVAAVERLVRAGEPVDVVPPDGSALLISWAAASGHTDLVRFLLDHGAYIEEPAAEGESPLMEAALHGHSDTVRFLLERGANPAYKTDKGWDVLQFAKLGEHPEVIAIVTQAFRAMECDR